MSETNRPTGDQLASGIHTASDLFLKALAEPFPAAVIGWKPGSVKGNRALAMAYIDARDVMDRLDAVCGIGGWEDEYTPIGDGNVMCVLVVHVGDRKLRKSDVGGPSEQPDGGDKMKAAFSDALKRAAVKFGIGRYLYRLSQQWADYDPQKRQFVKPPTLPDFALPASERQKSKPATAVNPPANNGPATSQLRGSGNIPPESITLVSAHQANWLRDKIKEKGVDSSSFLVYYGIKSIDQLPSDRFREAADRLAAK